MKILYYFPEYDTPMFSWQRVHIFDELKRQGIEIDAFNPLLCDSYDVANERIICMAKNGKYDLFMTCICSEKMLYYETLDAIKKMGLPTLSFRPDNLLIPFNDKNLASSFDLLWLTSVETQHLYKKWNARTIFLPYAANPYTFKPTNQPTLRNVCFVGRPYGTRPVMINALTSNKVEVDIFCKGNNNVYLRSSIDQKLGIILPPQKQVILDSLKFKEGRKMLYSRLLSSFKGSMKLDENNFLHYKDAMPCSELYKPYSTYALSLAATSAANSDILKDPIKVVQLRIFEVPMSGGIQLCKWNDEIAGYYEPNKEIVFYDSLDELVDKAVYYTKYAKDSEIVSIKHNARKRSEQEHTWTNRFNLIFKELGI